MDAEPSPGAIPEEPSAQSLLIEELRNVEDARSFFGSLTLFIVTLVLFFTTGIVSSDPHEIAILIGVLLFHELGHLAAMKMLGYRDVKMFFVPFLGAAVSGTSKTHSAARSCFVSIMGPLPGIFLSIAFFFLYLWTNNYYLLKTGQVMLLLNVFNLLPIMPLDGGRFVDVLFVRNRYFRLMFSLFGVACFVALAVSGGDIVMGLLAVLSLFGALLNFRVHRVANKMIAQGVSEKSFPELIASPQSFGRLMEVMRADFPKLFSPQLQYKAIHGQIIQVLDTVKFVPAKWAAKLVLSSLYGIVLVVSVALALFFTAANFREQLKFTHDASLISERYVFNSKSMEIPLNKDLYYHGTGEKFGKDTTVVEARIEYQDGYRTGRHVYFDENRDTSELVYYTRGRMDSLVKVHGQSRTRLLPGERKYWERLRGWIVFHSQPTRSNHRLFRD